MWKLHVSPKPSSSCSVHWVEAWLKKTCFVVLKQFSNCHPMLLQQRDICTWSHIAFITQTCHLHPLWSVTIDISNWFNEIISLRVYKTQEIANKKKKIGLPDKICLTSTEIIYMNKSIISSYIFLTPYVSTFISFSKWWLSNIVTFIDTTWKFKGFQLILCAGFWSKTWLIHNLHTLAIHWYK